MLSNVLESSRWDIQLIGPDTLTAELLAMVEERRPAAVCIATIPPGGLAHTRYLCKRLRGPVPRAEDPGRALGAHDITTTEATVSPGPAPKAAALKQATNDTTPPNPALTDPMVAGLKEAGADFVATSLLETRQQLASLVPVLLQGAGGRDDEGRAPRSGRAPARAADREVAAVAGTP